MSVDLDVIPSDPKADLALLRRAVGVIVDADADHRDGLVSRPLAGDERLAARAAAVRLVRALPGGEHVVMADIVSDDEIRKASHFVLGVA